MRTRAGDVAAAGAYHWRIYATAGLSRHRDNPQLLQHRQDILRMLGQAEDW